MEILSAIGVNSAEQKAFKLGITQQSLMERAGYAVFKECTSRFSPPARVLVLAGRGNNGGDGFVCARYLQDAGFQVRVMVLSGNEALPKLTLLQRQTARRCGVKIFEITPNRSLPDFNEYDLIIDALFGTGLNRPIFGLAASVIDAANKAQAWKLAVDLPSGLDASSLKILGECFLADLTVTFTRPKLPMQLYPTRAFCGEVVIADVGVPDAVVSSKLQLLTEKNTPDLPVRSLHGHKGDYGHAVIVGGSLGKTGASVLAGLSALRAGAGLVTCTLPGSLYNMLAAYPELMGFYCKSSTVYIKNDTDDIKDFLKESMALGLGPGIGRRSETEAFVRELIAVTEQKLVVDADALYALNKEALLSLAGRAVLTPHMGEFAAMAGVDKATLISQRLELALEYAVKYQVCLVLKSSETIITTSDGQQYISEWGTPALSKGGSGDILTGIITALLAQGYSLADAAKLGCRIQGEASRKASEKRAEYAVSPRDIVDAIGLK